jgi:hypothetical protein
MSTSRPTMLFLGLLSLPLLVAGTCREQKEVLGLAGSRSVTITVRNQAAALPIHILFEPFEAPIDGEPPAGNRLPPGVSRLVGTRDVDVQVGADFRAHRNSPFVSATVTCIPTSDGPAEVHWNGTALTCVGW